MTRNQSLIFASIPAAFPVPGEVSRPEQLGALPSLRVPLTPYRTGQTLKRVEGQIDLDAPLKAGEILTKTLSLSWDPYMRGRMRSEEIPSYVPAFKVSSSLENVTRG